jgi:pimeloyl-ACP methyl ester carboxylesterase
MAYDDKVANDVLTAPPVVLVHGWGGSFATTWQRSGFTDLLADAGRDVIGVDLLGHGTAPKPHEPEAYADLAARLVEALPDRPVDAIGFSLGAQTVLRAAVDDPDRFRRIVLAGVGRNVFERDDDMTHRIVAAIENGGDTRDDGAEDNLARLFAQYAAQPGNDPAALAAIMKRGSQSSPLTEEQLARVGCPVLIAVGDGDFVLPADRLVAALPAATLCTLRRTDHFATPQSFDFIDAALEFIDAVPT